MIPVKGFQDGKKKPVRFQFLVVDITQNIPGNLDEFLEIHTLLHDPLVEIILEQIEKILPGLHDGDAHLIKGSFDSPFIHGQGIDDDTVEIEQK
jgi:hypothetical protein